MILVSTKGLLSPTHREMQQHEGLSKSELLNQSIVPMAFPMLVCPGTLSTVVVLSEEKGLMLTIFAVVAALPLCPGFFISRLALNAYWANSHCMCFHALRLFLLWRWVLK